LFKDEEGIEVALFASGDLQLGCDGFGRRWETMGRTTVRIQQEDGRRTGLSLGYGGAARSMRAAESRRSEQGGERIVAPGTMNEQASNV